MWDLRLVLVRSLVVLYNPVFSRVGKKRDCTSLFMCESKCRLWSKITPKFLEEGLRSVTRGIRFRMEFIGTDEENFAAFKWEILLQVISVTVVGCIDTDIDLADQIEVAYRVRRGWDPGLKLADENQLRAEPRYQPSYWSVRPRWSDQWCP